MKKKLLTAAIGAALVAGTAVAQADVKVYGHLQWEVANEDVDTTLGTGTGDEFLRTNAWQGGSIDSANDGGTGSQTTVEDNQRGRFGIKASEKLGGGLTGLAMVEYDIGTGDFGGGPTLRESNVGLEGGFGTFLIGSMKTAYKYTGGVTYDPFVTTNLEARRNGGMTGGNWGQNGFVNNSLGYISPKSLPVKVWVTYSPDDNGSDSTGNGGSSVGDAGDYTASISFGGNNAEVFLKTAHNKHNTTNTVKQDYTANSVGGKFSMGPHTFLAQYEDTDEDQSTAGVSDEGELWFLGYHFKFGNNLLVLQYGTGELKRSSSSVKQEHDYYTLGLWHNLSKNTRLFAGYTETQVDNQSFTSGTNGDRTAFSAGLRVTF